MTLKEISKLDPFEGYPFKYIRVNISLDVYINNNKFDTTNKNGYWIDLNTYDVNSIVQAYVIRDKDKYNKFVDPSVKYKIACCKTIYTHYKLMSQ